MRCRIRVQRVGARSQRQVKKSTTKPVKVKVKAPKALRLASKVTKGTGQLPALVSHIESNCTSSHERVKRINALIDGRVCLTNYLHALYSLREWMGKRCATYVETGTLFGGSLALVMQCKTPCYYIGVDLYQGYYGCDIEKGSQGASKRITDATHLEHVQGNVDCLNVHNHPYDLVKGSSYAPETVSRVKDLLGDRKIDLLFIDGDHSLSGVTNDFHSYCDLVNRNGVVVFDNYADPRWPEVEMAVQDLDLRDYCTVGCIGHSLILYKK